MILMSLIYNALDLIPLYMHFHFGSQLNNTIYFLFAFMYHVFVQSYENETIN